MLRASGEYYARESIEAVEVEVDDFSEEEDLEEMQEQMELQAQEDQEQSWKQMQEDLEALEIWEDYFGSGWDREMLQS